MYDPYVTIGHLDAHKWAIMGLCSFAMIFNYIWFFAALRQAKIDRAYSVPAFTTLFWLAGDGSFLIQFHTWFHTYHDWYPELFWFALTVTVLFEIAFTAQLVRYGRSELLPNGTQQQFTALVAFGVVIAFVVWTMVRHVIVDPLGITYFDLANVSGPIAAGALMLRRRNRAGQTPLIWFSYAAMATIWFIAQYLWFGPEFRGGEFNAISILCVVCSVAMGVIVMKMPVYVPKSAESAETKPSGVLNAV